MPSLTQWDLGGCNCVGCACAPCNLAAINYHLTISNTHGSNSGNLLYDAIPGCHWTSDCIAIPGVLGPMYQMTFSCSGGCTALELLKYGGSTCTGAPVSKYYWDNPANCSGLNDGLHALMTLGANTCSPLSVAWTAGFDTLTLTP